MNQVITSLEHISQQYTVFAKDQVLTDQQLNSVTRYLDDQIRLSRTALSGVGIVSGLNLDFASGQIKLGKGLGITKDGDLFVIYSDIAFDRYVPYDEEAPFYPPFSKDDNRVESDAPRRNNEGARIPMFRLVQKDEDLAFTKPLDQLGNNINNLLFLLLAESYIEDKDICSSTDCDNAGSTYKTTMRLLVVDKEYAEYVSHDWQFLASEQEMPRLYLQGLQFEPEIDTQNEWFGKIRNACKQSANELMNAFTSFWPTYRPFLKDYYDQNPANSWQSKLQTLINAAKTETTRLQYFYESLDDMCQAWNALIDALEQLEQGALLPAGRGSKHLLLGDLKGDTKRSVFIPSPVHSQDAMQRVLFAINKLSNLISGFAWARMTALKITPSSHTLASVPGFYSEHVFQHWDFDTRQANRQRYLLGYHADKNRPLGGAELPLKRRQSSFDFYRIEGVLNKAFDNTQKTIQSLISKHHLPISVTGVLIEGQFFDVIRPIFPFQRNWSTLQYMFKKDLSYQLDDVKSFSGLFKDEIVSKSAQQPLIDTQEFDLPSQVQTRHNEINSQANVAKNLLNKSVLSDNEQAQFKSSITNVVKQAGLFKNDASKVSTTHFPTMLDQVIVNPATRYIDWLDILQKDEEKAEKEKSQLPHFLQQYPGMELSNGVVRGGTFVLIYNSRGTIVGTAMLSHYIPMALEQAPRVPELPKFDFPLDVMPLPGIQVAPSFELNLSNKFADFSVGITQQVDDKIANTSSYVDAFRDSINIVRDISIAESTFRPVAPVVPPYMEGILDDAFADGILGSLKNNEREIQLLDEQASKANSDEQKAFFMDRKKEKQSQVATDMLFLAKYVDDNKDIDEAPRREIISRLTKSGDALVGNQDAIAKIELGTKDKTTPILVDLNKNLGRKFGF